MGNWETVADGEKQDINKYLDFREYATLAARNTASAAFGASEIFHICRVVATAYYYYWSGSIWVRFPSVSIEEMAGEYSGSSPITVPHGLSSTPSWVVVTPKALQPYTVAYNADDTNVTVYHNAAGSLTVSVIAGV